MENLLFLGVPILKHIWVFLIELYHLEKQREIHICSELQMSEDGSNEGSHPMFSLRNKKNYL